MLKGLENIIKKQGKKEALIADGWSPMAEWKAGSDHITHLVTLHVEDVLSDRAHVGVIEHSIRDYKNTEHVSMQCATLSNGDVCELYRKNGNRFLRIEHPNGKEPTIMSDVINSSCGSTFGNAQRALFKQSAAATRVIVRQVTKDSGFGEMFKIKSNQPHRPVPPSENSIAEFSNLCKI